MIKKNISYRDVFSKSYKFILLVLIIISIPQFLFMPSLIGGSLTWIPILYFLVYCFFIIKFVQIFLKKVTLTKDGRVIARGDHLFYRFRREIPENIYILIMNSSSRGAVGWDFQFYFQLSNIAKIYIVENPRSYSGHPATPELRLANATKAICFEFKRVLEPLDSLGNINTSIGPNLNSIYISVADPERLVRDIENLKIRQ